MSRPLSSSPRGMAGVSLIELMIAMVIGLILMLGVTQVFIASRAASQLSEGVARTQENARFALDFLERDLRMAGHMGCVNDQAHVIKGDNSLKINLTGITSGDGSPLDFSVPIQGYDAAGTDPGDELTIGGTWSGAADLPASITSLSPSPIGGSDILVLRYLAPEGSPVLTITADPDGSIATIASDAAARLLAGTAATPSLFAVADCSRVDVFSGSLVNSTLTAEDTDLTGYAANNAVTMVYRAEAVVYYVARNTANEPSLFRARAQSNGTYANGEELVEGVESLQFLYGLDAEANISSTAPPTGNINVQRTAAGVSTGTDAAAVGQWRRVGMVQVGLLMRSPMPASAEQASEDQVQLGVLGVGFSPAETNDRRYRASYEVSVALRNRLFGN